MTFELRDIVEWRAMGCVPTALCAISGKRPDEIGRVLSDAAAEFSGAISSELRNDYDINHWLSAIKLLGGQWCELEDCGMLPYERRETDGLTTKRGISASLDTYTDGKRLHFDGVPASYLPFRRASKAILTSSSATSPAPDW